MNKKGYFPAKITFRTFIFSFNKIIKNRKVKDNIRVKEVKIKNKKKVLVRKFSNFGWDFIPFVGRIKRPTFSFNKILKNKKVKDDFSYIPIKSRLPERFEKHYFTSTDCPFSSNGILYYFDTSSGFFASVVKGKSERMTLWEVFGE